MNLHIGPQNASYPAHFAYEQISDGCAPIGVIYQSVHTPSIREVPDEVYVTVNGWGENAESFAAVNDERLRRAYQAGKSVGTISFTANRYRQDDQNEALVAVVENSIWETPVSLDTHSRGGITGVRTAPSLHSRGLIKDMLIKESCGNSRQDLSLSGLAGVVLSEVDCALELAHGKSRSAANALSRNLLGHLAKHPVAARQEVEELMNIDTTAETVALGNLSQPIPLLVVNGLRDRICSAAQSRAALEAAGLPVEQIVDKDMSHLSVLFRPSHIRELLDLQPVAAVPRQSAA
jgi:hypothetical protein